MIIIQCVTGVPDAENGAEAILKQITAENSPKLMKDINTDMKDPKNPTE